MNSKLLSGTLETIVLKLLSENGAMYGYEISKKVEELTQGEFKITEGALYPLLHRLEAKGIVLTETQKIGNRYRKYYTLTKAGKIETQSLLAEMKQFLKGLDLLINARYEIVK